MVPDVYFCLTGDDEVFTLEMKLRTGDSAQLVLKHNLVLKLILDAVVIDWMIYLYFLLRKK